MIVLREEHGKWGKKPSERSLDEHLRYGIALVDKPRGPTSHEVSSFVKKILGLRKTGHSGTLDANVSGVLPVLLEESCKASGFLLRERKSYVCVMCLSKEKTRREIEEAFSHFRGKIYQTPPLESAVVKKLRVREVFALKVLEVEGRDVLFECEVEAGFYVRKLVFDAGEVLGTHAQMLELRRTRAAEFSENDCVTLQDLSDAHWLWRERGDERLLRKMVLPIERAVFLKRVVVDDNAIRPITTGANIAVPGICALDEGIARGESVQVLSLKGELLCFATALLSGKEVKSRGKGIAFDVERVIHLP